MTDETLASFLGAFVQGFADKNHRRHLSKRGWIGYSYRSWHLTPEGRTAAIGYGLLKVNP